MTVDKDLKRLVRARMAKTGESYTAALARMRPKEGAEAPRADGPGLNPESSALARALREIGVTSPATGRPINEDLLFGIGGGIGFAYFLFEYPGSVSVHTGGRINPYVQKRDFLDAACERLGLRVESRTSSTAGAAEKSLRTALSQGSPVLVTVDQALLPFYGWPPEMGGSMPHTLLALPGDDAPRLYDLAPRPFTLSWPELTAARGRYRAAKNRIVTVRPPDGPVDIAAAIRAGIDDTLRGMLEPPMTNFGLAGLAKWARLVADPKDGKGWPTVFRDGKGLLSGLRWTYHWIETSGTGGGNFRAMYARFLDEAAGALDRPDLGAVADRYRALAARWNDLAQALLRDDVPTCARMRRLLDRRQALIAGHGAEARTEIDALAVEIRELTAAFKERSPLGEADLSGFLASLRGRIEALHDAEREAVHALRAAVG